MSASSSALPFSPSFPFELKRWVKEDQVSENICPVRAIRPALARSSITAVRLAMHSRLRAIQPERDA
eukprot:2435976-Pyramimonas_sp.AAC.2